MRDYTNDHRKFKELKNDMVRRNQCRKNNKKSIDIVRDIEILKIKLIDIENFLDRNDIFQIIQYLNSLTYYSNFGNFVIDKPEKEGFWMTIWKYQEHSTESDIIIKISYKKSTSNYNPRTNFTESVNAYSPSVYTDTQLLINYFVDYIMPILMIKNRDSIDPLGFR